MDFEVRNLRPWAARVILPACIGACLAGTLCLPPAFGQGQKTSGAGSTATNPGGNPVAVTPNSNLPAGFQPTPQFVSGKVMMDDGTQPPEGVVIELVCSGIARTEGHTDHKGDFGIELGHDQLVQEASSNGGAIVNPNNPVKSDDLGADPNRPYRECEIRGNLPGYRSDSFLLASYRPGENSNVGTILLHKMGNVEGSVISATTAAAPKNATKEYEKGLDAIKKGKVDDAVQAFNRAVALYPEFAAAWFELGKLQVSRQQLAEARKSFEAALKAEPKFISPYLQLSQLDFKAKNWQGLADVTGRLLQLDAVDFPQQYYYNGLANYTLQRMEPAEKSLRETVKLDTQNHFPMTYQFLAAILVKKNDLNGAVEELRNYLKFAPAAPDAESVRRQLYQLEKVTRSSAGPREVSFPSFRTRPVILLLQFSENSYAIIVASWRALCLLNLEHEESP
jgi:tetratricopeptide (TPR) repeat protein